MTDASRIRFDFNNMMAHSVGEEHGVRLDEIAANAERVAEAVVALAAEELPFMELPHRTDALRDMRRDVEALGADFDDLVVLGIGGSALGTTALFNALCHPFHNLTRKPRLHVMDNADPDWFGALMETVDPARALYLVVTKSGSTAETMAQYLIVREALKPLGGDWRRRMVLITDPEKGALRRMADEEGFPSFAVPPDVGGRFSVLSAVGLVPALLMGMDAEGLLAGAQAMDARCRETDVRRNPAAMGALLQYLLDTERGKTIAVTMPYAEALEGAADWFGQLWAESLGKRLALDGSEVFAGQTPVKAVGTTDQHSQIQLYVEGPNDKTITFLAAEQFGRTPRIPEELKADKDVGYLCGRTMNELFEAERIGTQLALTEAQRPNATLTLPRVDARSLGALFYLFEVQTAIAGKLYGVNAFHQPGVEAGKDAAYALLGREGYENLRREIESRPEPDGRYVI